MIPVRVWMSLSLLLLVCSLPMLAQQSAANAIVPFGKAPAQTMTFRAYIPFPFVVGNETLPAGVYQIQRLMGRSAEGDTIGMIVVRSTDARVYKAVVTNLVRPPQSSGKGAQLLFARHGDQHYLSEFHIAGEKGHKIPNIASQSELVQFDVLECEESRA